MFLADVDAVRVVELTEGFRIEVSFRVLEGFKGIESGLRVVRFGRPTVEDFKFQVGQRVLVYAYPSEGELAIQCSRTRLVDQGAAELEILRSLVRKRPGGLLEGELMTVARDGRQITNHHPGFKVSLRSKSDGARVLSVTTDGAGHFQFNWVAPGDYILTLEGGEHFGDQRREIAIQENQRCLTLPPFLSRPQ